MFKFLEFVEKIRPKPFKRLQRWLSIEEEWSTFKSNLRPHRYKMITITVLCFYPLYQPYLQRAYTTMNVSLQTNLEQTKPIAKISESFVKDVVMGTLRDPQIRRDSGLFVENLAKKQLVVDSIVHLLVQGVKDPIFIEEAKHLTKGLAHKIVQDQTLQKDVAALFVNLLRDPEVKNELIDVLKWSLGQEETKEAAVNLCREGFKDERMLKATNELFSNTVHNVLIDPDTVEKFKLFSFYVLETEGKANQSPKGLIDMVLGRVMKGGYKGEVNDTELKRLLKAEGKDELYNSIEKKMESSKEEGEKPQSKFFFF